LAFGVGVTLTRNAARLAAGKSAASLPRPVNSRTSEPEVRSLEQPMERKAGPPPVVAFPPNRQSADAVQTAIDGRFAEIGGQIDRRIGELELRIKTELDALDAQDHAVATGTETRLDELRAEINEAFAKERQSIDGDMRGLRTQMSAIHKEFAETLARLVDEQIAKTVAVGLRAVAEELREGVREEIRLSGKDQQIAELRERMDGQERTVRELVTALGQSCLRAVGRMAPAEPPSAPSPPPVGAEVGGAAPPEGGVESAADPELPGFARSRPRKPLWRLPIVSTFLAATGGLLLLHYL
jgi:uncharacterized coiled-coil protein SlyX